MRSLSVPLAGIALGTAFLAMQAYAAKLDLSKLPPPSSQKDVTYEKHIKPLFARTCVKCHGPEKQKAKLRLDSLAAALHGADNGKEKVILPGKSAQSPLVQLVARLDEDDAMPPEGKGDPLTPAQVGLIRAWIDQGAK